MVDIHSHGQRHVDLPPDVFPRRFPLNAQFSPQQTETRHTHTHRLTDRHQ